MKQDKREEMLAPGPEYEYCPNCYANLLLQKGFRNDLPYWICKGCGEMLINPEVEAESGIAWICDRCGAMLNIQEGFDDRCGEWQCTECGFTNKIEKSELYTSEDEYQATLRDPYKGLSDEDTLELSLYQDIEYLNGRYDIILIRHRETGVLRIKKLLTTYNRSIYDYLIDHPVEHMPQIIALYESSSRLIVIEEYVKGKTVSQLLDAGALSEEKSIRIARSVCAILTKLHNLPTSIVHRDIKPSNVIITPEGEVYLLDMNVAKWYDPEKTDDTEYMGTRHYAAPEQVGYGLMSSSPKADIYAAGVFLNVMLTGKYPKEQMAAGRLRKIIERCISLDAKDRFTAEELIANLDDFKIDE